MEKYPYVQGTQFIKSNIAIRVINTFHNLKCMTNAYPYYSYQLTTQLVLQFTNTCHKVLFLCLASANRYLCPLLMPQIAFSPTVHLCLILIVLFRTLFQLNQVGKDSVQGADFMQLSLASFMIQFSILYQLAFAV